MYNSLFEQQEALGLKPCGEFAKETGVPDGGAFNTCVKRTDPIPRVIEEEQLGKGILMSKAPPR